MLGPAVTLPADAASAQTVSQQDYLHSTRCFRNGHREEYVARKKDKPGHVRNWSENVEIACEGIPERINNSKDTYSIDVLERRRKNQKV